MKKILFLVTLWVFIVFTGCSNESNQSTSNKNIKIIEDEFGVVPDINGLPLVDDESIYKDDDPDSLVNMYLTIFKSEDPELSNYTFADLNSFKYTVGVKSPDLEVLFQLGDSKGPISNITDYEANASISVRGHSTLGGEQKSYKIKLF